LVNAKALLEQNGYSKALVNPQQCGSNLGANQGVHLDGSEREEVLFKKVKQGFEIMRRGFRSSVLEKQ
jgi:hypothetical protein